MEGFEGADLSNWKSVWLSTVRLKRKTVSAMVRMN